MEVRVDDDGDTYRTMYTTEMEGVVYVLDVFKKKSKAGIATPQADIIACVSEGDRKALRAP
jgi:phage-related protein